MSELRSFHVSGHSIVSCSSGVLLQACKEGVLQFGGPHLAGHHPPGWFVVSLCPTATVSWSKIPSRPTGFGQEPFHALTALTCLVPLKTSIVELSWSFWTHSRGKKESQGAKRGLHKAGLSSPAGSLEKKSPAERGWLWPPWSWDRS